MSVVELEHLGSVSVTIHNGSPQIKDTAHYENREYIVPPELCGGHSASALCAEGPGLRTWAGENAVHNVWEKRTR